MKEKIVFPDIVLLKIFSNLSIHDLGRASLVCKQWNTVVQSDVVWKRFVPKWPWFEPPPDTQGAYFIVQKLWRKKSVRIGNERWLPNPIPELVRYIKRLKKAEFHQYYRGYSSYSTMTLVTRLNPCYEFTTKGKDLQDEKIREVCEEIWNNFGNKKDECHFEITSHLDVMKHAKFLSRKEAMAKIVKMLEPKWFLQALELAPYALNENGDIVNRAGFQAGGSVPVEGDDQDEVMAAVHVSSDRSIFGPYRDSTAWKTRINTRLPMELFDKVKTVFADGSEHFIQYFLNDGFYNENFMYEYSLVISDTAVFHYRKYYDL